MSKIELAQTSISDFVQNRNKTEDMKSKTKDVFRHDVFRGARMRVLQVGIFFMPQTRHSTAESAAENAMRECCLSARYVSVQFQTDVVPN